MVEKELFDYLVKCCYPDLVMANNKMSRWDCYSPAACHRIELKCRSVHYDTLVLEKKKYDAMMKVCLNHLDIPIYICSTPKGIYSFNLFLIKPVWQNQYMKKTTKFTNNNYIEKEVAMLPVIDAKIL